MKTGLHANSLRDADLILEYYRRSQAPTFKAMDFDEGFFKTLKGVCPHVQIIGRVYEDNQQLGAAGGRFNKKVVEHARAFPTVDFWEGYNEAFPTPGDIGRYAELEVERVTMLAAVGKRAIVGNFSCGTPEIAGDDPARCWREFLPAVRAAMAHRGGVGKHEYDAPWMDRLVIGDLWNPAAEGWLCLRYRKDAKILAALGVPLVHWYFTETGVDGGVTNRPGPVGGGWADFRDHPSPALGAYDKQRRWYSWQLSHDPNAKGLVSFGESSVDPTWHSFSAIRDRAMMDAIIAAEKDLPTWHVGAPAPPPPQPQPTPPEQPMDAFSAILRRKLGNRFSDDRAIMPKHATAKYSPLNPAAYKGIAVHHSASARGTAPASIADYHVTHNGWAGIGYHVVIRQGVAHYVGDIATQRAHVAGRNHELAGVCVTGDYTKEAPRTEDLDTLRLVVEALDELLGKQLPINGHGGWALAGHKTECPGALVGPAREIRGGGGAPTQPRPVQWGKVAWFLEDMVRRMEAEGQTTEAALVKSTWLPEAIRHRDKPGS